MKIIGVAAHTKIPNANNTIYEPNAMKKALVEFKKIVDMGRAIGELGQQPLDPIFSKTEVNLNRASHIVSEISFDESSGEVISTLDTIDSRNGRIMDAIIEKGLGRPGMRGFGTTEVNEDGVNVVKEFNIISVGFISKEEE